MTLKNMPPQIRLSTKTLFKSVGILQLKDIFQLELAKFMQKATKNDLLKNLNQMFTPISSIHRYPTSSSRKRVFVKPKANKSAYRNWISSTGISLWFTDLIKIMAFFDNNVAIFVQSLKLEIWVDIQKHNIQKNVIFNDFSKKSKNMGFLL